MPEAAEAVKPLLVLVDDDQSVLDALEAEIGFRFGDLCRIETFQDPRDMLEATAQWSAAGRSIALIITDQRMPGLTGLELIDALRPASAATGPAERSGFDSAEEARSVLLTGYGGADVERLARASGVHRYREKPWNGDALAHDIRYLLGDYWRAAQEKPDPTYREFVAHEDLRRLWERLEPAEPRAAAPHESSVLDGAEDAQVRHVLSGLVDDEDPAVESQRAMLEAILTRRASPEERTRFIDALSKSKRLRKELTHLVLATERLSDADVRTFFDEVALPAWVEKLSEAGPEEDGI